MNDSINTSRRSRITAIVVVTLLAIGALVLAAIWFGGESGENSDPATNSPATGSEEVDEASAASNAQSTGSNGSSTEGPTGDDHTIQTLPPSLVNVLPSSMNGQAAVDALGENFEAVAKKNGKTVEELEDLLLTDPTAYVSTSGFLFYRDTAQPEN